MRRTPRKPRYFAEVIRAIYELNEIGGSNCRKIVDYVTEAVASKTAYPPSNMTVQVKNALNQAVHSGIVGLRAGRFRIDRSKLEGLGDPLKKILNCRRRQRRKPPGRKRGARRRKGAAHSKTLSERNDKYKYYKDNKGRTKKEDDETSASEEEASSGSDNDHDKSVTEARRRRRKHHSRKKHRRGRRRKRSLHGKHSEERNAKRAKRGEDTNDNGDNGEEKDYSDDYDDRKDRYRTGNRNFALECDDPDCLCHVKRGIRDEHMNQDETNNSEDSD